MKSMDMLYGLLQDKINSQLFYNGAMVRMVNPLARDLFKTIRDEEESDVLRIRRMFLALEARPMILKTFIPARKPAK
jgi:hypothetical protein